MSYKKQELVDKEFDEKFPLIKQTGYEEVEGTFFHEEDRVAVKEFIANQRKKDLEAILAYVEEVKEDNQDGYIKGMNDVLDIVRFKIKLNIKHKFQSLNK